MMIPGQKQKQLFHLLDPSYPAFPGPCSLLLLQEGKDLKIRIFFFFQTNAATLNSRSKFNADMSPLWPLGYVAVIAVAVL